MANSTPLHGEHERLGARFGAVADVEVPRNYGDPAAEYRAVRTGAGVVDRSDRVAFRVHGRDPVKMIQGLITNDLVGGREQGGVYAALLTPKGKMVADLRVLYRPEGDLLLDVDRRAAEGVRAHLKKYVPPLFARAEEAGDYGVLGVYGPRARAMVGEVLDRPVGDGLPEDAVAVRAFGDHTVLAVRTLYTGEDGYDLFVPATAVEALWTALTEAGARPVGHGTLEVLRIEAGRPRWGAELDETVIPLEAGLRQRAISETKGCYTGQEVIVRILHRGHVNWHLRGFLLDDAPAPAKDTPLVREGNSKTVARITSACMSPRHGQTIGLGYARRELEPPVTLRLGDAEGPEAVVVDLPFPTTDVGEPASVGAE